MITVRPSKERGQNREDWLETHHTFSFHNYYDPQHMGYSDLRVINEDTVAANRGFGMHPHEDMEIVTFVTEGELEHQDTMGNKDVIGPYQLQRMTAGRGIRHSEVNPSRENPVHLFQIWIYPEENSLEPGYEIKDFADAAKNRLTLLASPDGEENAAKLHQNARLYLGRYTAGSNETVELNPERHTWLQVIKGSMNINGASVNTGDGVAIEKEKVITLHAEEDSEFLLFDLN
mgnify:CR=1 FL=1